MKTREKRSAFDALMTKADKQALKGLLDGTKKANHASWREWLAETQAASRWTLEKFTTAELNDVLLLAEMLAADAAMQLAKGSVEDGPEEAKEMLPHIARMLGIRLVLHESRMRFSRRVA